MQKINITLITILFLLLLSCPSTGSGSGGSSGGGDSDEPPKRSDNAYKVNINLTGSLQNPAWSPDGKSLLFTRFRDGYNTGRADLYKINLETNKLTMLVNHDSANVNLPGSVWYSNQIVFSSSRNPHDEIYTINDNGTGLTKRTERNGFQAYEPSFSSDGLWIVFESHVVDVEGNGIIIKKLLSDPIDVNFTELTSSGDCRQPNWAPAGNRILFQKIVGIEWDIFIMNTDGTGQTQVTTSDGDNTDASFSPDGLRIVYSTDGDLECANLYVIPITGGTPKRLTFYNGGYDGAPSWSPDPVKKVAFESYPGDPDDFSGTSGTTIWIIDIPDGF